MGVLDPVRPEKDPEERIARCPQIRAWIYLVAVTW